VKLLAMLLFGAMAARAQAVYGRPTILRNVGIDQKMGAQVPLDIPFADEAGQPVTLQKYLGKPDFGAGLLSMSVALQHGSEWAAAKREGLEDDGR